MEGNTSSTLKYDTVLNDSSLLQILLEQSNDYIYFKDRNSRFIKVNQKILEVFGLNSEEEILGKTDKDFFPDIADQLRTDEQQIMETGKPQLNVSLELVFPDGRKHWISISKTPFYDNQGNVAGIVGISRDITKQKKLEETLRENENKLRNLIDLTSEFIWQVDENGVYTFVSDNISNIVGYDSSEIIGKTPFDFMNQKEAERVGLLFSKIVAKKDKITQLEDTWIHKEGYEIIFETDGTPLVNEKDELTGYFGICRDITRRKKTEEALKKNEKKYHTLFEHMAQGVFYQRADGTIFDVNPAALEMFGLREEQTLGRTSDSAEWKVIREDGSEIPSNQHPSMKALRTGKPIYNEIVGVFNPTKNDYVWLSTNVIPQFKPGENKPYQVFVTLHDITNEKKAEQALKESERKYKELFSNAVVGIDVHNADGSIHSVNKRAEEIFGLSEEELKKKNLDFWKGKLIKPDGSPMKESDFPLSIVAQSKAPSEGKIIGLSMSEHRPIQWFYHSARPILDDQGEIDKVVTSFVDITDRKKMEDELQASEEKYRMLYEAQVNGFAIFESVFNGKNDFISYKFIDINPAYERITNVKREEVKGKDIQEVFPGTEQSWIDAYGSVAMTGKPKTFEMYHEPTRKYYYCNVFRPWDDNKRFCVAFNDITERKKGEQKIRDSERKYREIVELSPDGIATSDMKGFVTSVNSSFLEITGYSKDEIIGKHVSRLPTLNFKQLPNYLRIYKNILTGKQTKPFIFQWKHKNGQLRWGECRFTVQKKDGKKSGVQVNLRDITETVEYEKQLKEKQKQLNLALEGGELGTWDWNIKTNEVQFNRRWAEMKGYKPEEINPHLTTWEQLVHPEDLPKAQQILNDHLNRKTPFYEAEYRMKHKSGKWIWILDKGKIIELNKRGKPLRACGTHLDITKRKNAEIELQKTHEKLRKLNNQLEEKVQQRTKELEKVIKLKDEFINQLGHDLKNPLGPFIQLVPILKSHATREKDQQMLDALERNARYMKNLVKKTIELAKLNSSKIEFSFEPTALDNILETVLSTNQTFFDEYEMAIDNKITFSPMVNVDRLRIEEVFNNLFNNAVKYRAGPGTITLDAQQEKDKVVLSIKDTGIGITDEQIGHLFDEYYKADSSRHDFDSSGLGLPICKRIIEKHGGKIWVESDGINKGSTFYFTLPLAK